MAKKEKENLIGHDPLSWMKENSEEGEEDMSSDNEQLTTIDREDNAPVVLQATVNIQNITDLYEKLKIVLNNNESVEIDASAVTSIDTSALQVFTLLKQTALQMNKQIHIEFPSDQFVNSAKLCGLAELLEVDQVASGLF